MIVRSKLSSFAASILKRLESVGPSHAWFGYNLKVHFMYACFRLSQDQEEERVCEYACQVGGWVWWWGGRRKETANFLRKLLGV